MGGAWKLQSMVPVGQDRFTPDDPNSFTVELRAEGEIAVVADCNQCGGSYTVANEMLTVSGLACTLVACPTPAGEQFAALIDGTSSLELEDDELQITSADGTVILTR